MITLNLSRADNAEGVYLNLPAPPAKISYAFSELDKISSDTSTTKIVDVVSNVYNLNDYLKSADVEQPGILDKIGELARILQTMDRDSCLKFEGVLDANSVNSIDDILRLSEALDQYTLIHDAASGSTLGKYLVNNGAMSFPERICPYLDYQIIGEEFYADHRLSRFAKDIHDLILGLDLKDVTILGWSMGCSVIWSYWDLFGSERLSKIILVDEPGWLLKTEENDLGLWSYDELLANVEAINADKVAYTKALIDGLLTKKMPEEDVQFLIAENLKMPAEYTARLAIIHWFLDWRDIIPTISLPTMIIGGKKSFVNWHSQVWNNEMIPGSKLELFEDRGHLMFFEEPEKFNKIVSDFID